MKKYSKSVIIGFLTFLGIALSAMENGTIEGNVIDATISDLDQFFNMLEKDSPKSDREFMNVSRKFSQQFPDNLNNSKLKVTLKSDSSERTLQIDKNGQFLFKDIPFGTYNVYVEKPNCQNSLSKWTRTAIACQSIIIDSMYSQHRLNFYLSAYNAQIKGRVIHDGIGVADARVTAKEVLYGDMERLAKEWITQTDSNGYYELYGVQPESYFILGGALISPKRRFQSMITVSTEKEGYEKNTLEPFPVVTEEMLHFGRRLSKIFLNFQNAKGLSERTLPFRKTKENIIYDVDFVLKLKDRSSASQNVLPANKSR